MAQLPLWGWAMMASPTMESWIKIDNQGALEMMCRRNACVPLRLLSQSGVVRKLCNSHG